MPFSTPPSAADTLPLVDCERLLDIHARSAVDCHHCPPLQEHGLVEVGMSHVGGQWCFIRNNSPFALILVTLSGRGLVYLDGQWTEAGAETAYVLPLGSRHGYRTSPTAGEWHYAWAKLEPARFAALFPGVEPRLVAAPSYSIAAANRGLIAEYERARDPHLCGMWAELIQTSIQHLFRPQAIDPRIANLWAHINARLGDDWDIDRMSRVAHLSREHIRRLCQRHYSCSPRRRLTELRLRKACELLRLTDATLYDIAASIGFSEPFSFSQAFKREFGLPPSAYRAQARGKAGSGRVGAA